ncbi:MAG: hypothetical protein ACO3SJ_11495, partial [Phycisphaerales bacterium]
MTVRSASARGFRESSRKDRGGEGAIVAIASLQRGFSSIVLGASRIIALDRSTGSSCEQIGDAGDADGEADEAVQGHDEA